MNIFKTFETFLKEPLSILKNNWIQIVSMQTDNIFEHQPSCEVSVLKDRTQITVFNNENLYKFLSLVTHKTEISKQNKQKLIKS